MMIEASYTCTKTDEKIVIEFKPVDQGGGNALLLLLSLVILERTMRR